MRVIAGEFKGRRLVTVKGLQTRPILDRAKESLFGILAEELIGARVLDLFSGAGTIAIESLSRGAEFAVLVDVSRKAREAAWKNITSLDIADRVEFICSDARRAVNKLISRGATERFQLIFVDPPYFSNNAKPILTAIREGDLLAVFSAGAYGMVMASNYNSRPRPAEVLVSGDLFDVIRTRETWDDLIRGERKVARWD